MCLVIIKRLQFVASIALLSCIPASGFSAPTVTWWRFTEGRTSGTQQGVPAPVRMWVLPKGQCSACERLEWHLRANGVRLTEGKLTGRMTFSGFPTVQYSDGNMDFGQMIYSGQCRKPESVEVVTYGE